MSKLGAYARIAFCPLCGVESLEKDRYRAYANCPVAEYICKSCGFGFRIGESARVQLANKMHKDERKQRHNKFEEDVAPEVKQKFVEYLEGPLRRMSLRTWLREYLPRFRRERELGHKPEGERKV